MTLVKRNTGLFPTIPSFFDDFVTKDWFDWSPSLMSGRNASLPAVNLKETDHEFEVEVAAPGLAKDKFHVELDNDLLTISYQDEGEKEEKSEGYTRKEFHYTNFKRSFTLPQEMVNAEKISANYKEGVLHINIPKREEVKPKPVKTIKIS